MYRKLVEKLDGMTVHKAFKYDPETGILWRRMATGLLKEVGTNKPDENGKRRLVVTFGGKQYHATHIIWLYMTGKWPTLQVEHEDTDAANNRWHNLREATGSQNMANISVTRRSKSGVKGVFWDKDRQKWSTYITKNYKTRFLGRFDSVAEAKECYDAENKRLNGQFARP